MMLSLPQVLRRLGTASHRNQMHGRPGRVLPLLAGSLGKGEIHRGMRCFPFLIKISGMGKPAQQQMSVPPGYQTGIPVIHIGVVGDDRVKPAFALIMADVQKVFAERAHMRQSLTGGCGIHNAFFVFDYSRPSLIAEKAVRCASHNSKFYMFLLILRNNRRPAGSRCR